MRFPDGGKGKAQAIPAYRIGAVQKKTVAFRPVFHWSIIWSIIWNIIYFHWSDVYFLSIFHWSSAYFLSFFHWIRIY